MSKIIIVGGTGFLGFHLAKYFIKKKWKVVSVSRKKPKKIRKLSKVTYVLADIRKKVSLKKKLSQHIDAKYLVNFGGEVEHIKKLVTRQSHFNGTKNLSNIFQNSKLEKFIQIGSSLEYGKFKSPHTENLPNNPVSNYAKSKSDATLELIKKIKKLSYSVIILRPYQVFGPYQDFNRFIPIIINECLKKNHFPCSNGKQFRDFLYIDDFVDAIIKSLRSKVKKYEIFNIGYGKPQNIKKVILHIRRIVKGGKPLFGRIKFRKEENLVTYPSIKKAKNKLKWYPKTNFYKGVAKTIKFYKKGLK